MGRFAKLNDDIQELGLKVLQNQDLCKLIHYPDTDNPMGKPNINGVREILNKRLLLFTHKMPLVETEGAYLLIRPDSFKPSKGGHFLSCSLIFEVYVHEKIRPITYVDKSGDIKKGDRAILILDMIEEFMSTVNFSIGDSDFLSGGSIGNRDSEFTGFGIAYRDVDFRNQGK